MDQQAVARAIKLSDPECFYDEFRRLTAEMTQEAAYRQLEADYQRVFGRRRYASLESFLTVYYRRLKTEYQP